MDRENIGPDEIHRGSHLVRADDPRTGFLGDDLRGADVRELERYGPAGYAGVAFRVLALEDRGPLAPDTHGDPDVGRRVRQVVVDLRRVGESPGHARDDERGGQALPEELDRRVDLAKIDLGQRVVHELDVGPVFFLHVTAATE